MEPKFKTAKDAKDFYIHLFMDKCVNQEQYEKEVERYRSIVGCSGKPLASMVEQKFVKYVDEHVYKGNTTFDRMCKKLNISPTGDKYKIEEKIIKKLGLDKAQEMANEYQKESRKIIADKFHEELDNLNNIFA